MYIIRMLDQLMSEETISPLHHHILLGESHTCPRINPYVFWDLLLHPLRILAMFLAGELEADVVLLEG